jgi:hypothetical protein
MNTDVQKSLGYLKKSLKMTRRAIANAVSQDAQALVELNVIATGINNLINEIENVDPAVPVVPAVVGGAAIGNALAPNPKSYCYGCCECSCSQSCSCCSCCSCYFCFF